MLLHHLFTRLPWNRFAKRRRRFLEKHRTKWVTDEDFVHALFGEGSHIEFTIGRLLRRLIARQCMIEPERLGKQDRAFAIAAAIGREGTLGFFLSYGVDYVRLISELEGELLHLSEQKVVLELRSLQGLGMAGPCKIDSKQSFGDWIKRATASVARELSRRGITVLWR